MREDGKIDYVELPAAAFALAKAFYGQAFGWTFTDYGPDYCAFDEGIDGGLNGDAEHPITAPLVVIYAADIDAMQAKVEAAGGVIVRPTFAFPGGRRFHFRDPAGTELAVATYD